MKTRNNVMQIMKDARASSRINLEDPINTQIGLHPILVLLGLSPIRRREI